METLFAICHESSKQSFYEVIESINIRKFNRINFPLAKITNLSENDLRHSRSIWLLQMKEVISMNNSSNTSSRKQ